MNKTNRRAASEAAKASVELEGFEVPKDVLVETERFIDGDITLQEIIDRLYKNREKNHTDDN